MRTISQILVLAHIITVSCNAGFTPDTLIYTPSDYTPIAELQAGDHVVSCDQTDKCALHRVHRVTSYITHDLFSITCDNTTIYADAQQLFFVPERQAWKSALQLAPGDMLYQGDGTYTRVKDVHSVPGDHKVYSITVAESHNFYVTHKSIFVHNDLVCIPTAASTIFGSISASPVSITLTVHPAVAGGAAIGAVGYMAYTMLSGKAKAKGRKKQCDDQPQSPRNVSENTTVNSSDAAPCTNTFSLSNTTDSFHSFHSDQETVDFNCAHHPYTFHATHEHMTSHPGNNISDQPTPFPVVSGTGDCIAGDTKPDNTPQDTNTSFPVSNDVQDGIIIGGSVPPRIEQPSVLIFPISENLEPWILYKNKGKASSNHDKVSKSNSQQFPNDPCPELRDYGAQAPGKPQEVDGFVPPKNWDGQKVKHPVTGQFGWPDKKGNVWVPTGIGDKAHGGAHWDVIDVTGNCTNILPGGKTR